MGLDEPQHFARAWSVSQGHLVSVREPGDRVGVLMSSCDWAFVGRLNHDVSNGVAPVTLRELTAPNPCPPGPLFVPHENTAVNSPLAYLPQAGAIAVTRGLGLSSLATYYAGRIAGLLLYVLLGTVALALAPRGRTFLFAVGVFPMSLVQAATYSADTAAIGCGLLLAALVLRALAPAAAGAGGGRTRRGGGLWVATVAVAVALSLTKNTLVVAAPVLLLVPTGWARSRRKEAVARAGSVGLCLAAAAGWYLAVRHVSLAALRVPGSIKPGVQARVLLRRPQRFVRVLFKTVTTRPQEQVTFRTTTWMFNPYRQRGSFAPPTWLAGVALLHLVVAGAADRGPRRALDRVGTLAARLPQAVLVVGMSIAVVSLWVTWTAVDSTVVEGIQGRYVLPFLPLLAITTALRHEEGERPRTTATILCALALLAALAVGVFLRYWH